MAMRFSMISSHGLPFAQPEDGIQPGLELIDRQMQRMQDEISRLVERRGGAMAIYEPGCVEAADGITQPVAYA